VTEQLHSHKSGCQIQEAMEDEADHMKSEGSDFFKHYFGSLSTACKVGFAVYVENISTYFGDWAGVLVCTNVTNCYMIRNGDILTTFFENWIVRN